MGILLRQAEPLGDLDLGESWCGGDEAHHGFPGSIDLAVILLIIYSNPRSVVSGYFFSQNSVSD